ERVKMSVKRNPKTSCVPSTLLTSSMEIFLKHLELSGESVQVLPVELRERCLHCMALRGLLTDHNLKNVVHRKLRKLDLSVCPVTEEGLTDLNICTKLEKLNLNSAHQQLRFSSQSLIDLFQHCGSLQELNLCRCDNVSDATVVSLSECCPDLRVLNLKHCPRVSDVSMAALGHNCRFLQGVDLSRNSITDAGIMALVAGDCCNTLEDMSLQNIELITKTSVERILEVCPRLKYINFSGCPNIQDIDCDKPLRLLGWTIPF
ncbi:protein AMN1 homolog, partial [Argonauta hians]